MVRVAGLFRVKAPACVLRFVQPGRIRRLALGPGWPGRSVRMDFSSSLMHPAHLPQQAGSSKPRDAITVSGPPAEDWIIDRTSSTFRLLQWQKYTATSQAVS